MTHEKTWMTSSIAGQNWPNKNMRSVAVTV